MQKKTKTKKKQFVIIFAAKNTWYSFTTCDICNHNAEKWRKHFELLVCNTPFTTMRWSISNSI